MKLRALWLSLPLVACAGAPTPSPVDSSMIVVPPQPPQPTPIASAPVVTSTPALAAPFKCDAGKRFEVLGRSYCAYTDAESWETSERRCVGNGGHLMTLDSKTTSDMLHAALGSPVGDARAAWIGLELKKPKTGKAPWTWITGAKVAAASWNDGEPNDFGGNEACGEWLVSGGRWNDTRCEMKQPYLCQAKGDKSDKGLGCTHGAFSAGGVSYCLVTVDRSFADAKRACASEGGQLAVLDTSEKNQAVHDAMAARFAAPRMWIGANDGGEEGRWSWVSGASFGFEAWLPGEPNNFNREDCAELHADTWRWNDFDCGAKLPSVCEGPPSKK